jgi:hypothetical protein
MLHPEHGEARLASTTDVPATSLRTLLRIDAKEVRPDACKTAENKAAQVALWQPRAPLTRSAEVAEEKRIGTLEYALPARLEGCQRTIWLMGHLHRLTRTCEATTVELGGIDAQRHNGFSPVVWGGDGQVAIRVACSVAI